MHVALMSQNAFQTKHLCKICGNYENLRSLLDFVINSAIAESQNPGKTALYFLKTSRDVGKFNIMSN